MSERVVEITKVLEAWKKAPHSYFQPIASKDLSLEDSMKLLNLMNYDSIEQKPAETTGTRLANKLCNSRDGLIDQLSIFASSLEKVIFAELDKYTSQQLFDLNLLRSSDFQDIRIISPAWEKSTVHLALGMVASLENDHPVKLNAPPSGYYIYSPAGFVRRFKGYDEPENVYQDRMNRIPGLQGILLGPTMQTIAGNSNVPKPFVCVTDAYRLTANWVNAQAVENDRLFQLDDIERRAHERKQAQEPYRTDVEYNLWARLQLEKQVKAQKEALEQVTKELQDIRKSTKPVKTK